MLDELRRRIAALLSEHQVGLLTAWGPEGGAALPVHYRGAGLEIECLVPRWTDTAYYLTPDRAEARCSASLLVLLPGEHGCLRWLACHVTACPLDKPDWSRWPSVVNSAAIAPERLYLVVHLTPGRIDLMDESRGWGARETLEFATAQ